MGNLIPLGDRVWVLPGGVNIGVVRGPGGEIAFIDTGLNETSAKKALKAVREELDGEVSAVLTTHSHADHFGGNATVVKRTGAKVHAPVFDEAFLRYPLSTLRQTDEGTVMIGDSKEEGTDPAGMTLPINGVMASRAVRIFPRLASLNVVRTWRAIRVMPQDGFPIYEQSTTHPGAFLVTCHSGVTLAAGHALSLAPMIAAGQLDQTRVGAFSARRFHAEAAQ